MTVFQPFPEQAWSEAKGAFDPDRDRTTLESLQKFGLDFARLPRDLARDDIWKKAGDMFTASAERQQFNGTIMSSVEAQAGAFDRYRDRIKSVAGVDIGNPITAARRDFALTLEAVPDFGAGPGLPQMRAPENGDYGGFLRGRVDAYFAQVRALKQQHAGKLDDLPDHIDADAAGHALRRDAEAANTREWGRTDGNSVIEGAAMLAGGLWGSRHDPITWASFAVPGGGQGATAVGRILNAMIWQGGANAAGAALSQPFIQQQRADAGMASGLMEAAEDVALAAAAGAVLGGGIKGIGEIVSAVRAGKLKPADVPAAAEAAGARMTGEAREALVAAAEADAATAAAVADVKGVPPARVAEQMGDALRHLEEPLSPMPLRDPVIPAGVDDALARSVTDGMASLDEAVAALRRNPDAVLSALASNDPALRDAGRLARLSDEALDVAQRRAVPPDQAALIAAHTDDPLHQAAMVNLLADRAPGSAMAARMELTAYAAITEAVERAKARAVAPDALPPALRIQHLADADGRVIVARPVVVEASEVLASSDKGYLSWLQPRDRSRAASEQQIREMATRLQPERLGFSTEVDRGAPLVGPDGMVESGNGRIMALREAYRSGHAAGYRAWLETMGVDVGNYREPVLVRVRETELDDAGRRALVVSANRPATLTLGASEVAFTDAPRLTGEMLAGIEVPGNLSAIGNRGFVRQFLSTLPQTEHGALVTSSGDLTQTGLMRVRNALVARAYGDLNVIGRIAESLDDDARSLSNALVMAAPHWARLRVDVAGGHVPVDLDITGPLMEAVAATVDIRGRGLKLSAYLAQGDFFGAVKPEVAALMEMFYLPGGNRAAGQDRIADVLETYVRQARQVTTDAGLDLGLPPVQAGDVLGNVMERAGHERPARGNVTAGAAGTFADAGGNRGAAQGAEAGGPGLFDARPEPDPGAASRGGAQTGDGSAGGIRAERQGPAGTAGDDARGAGADAQTERRLIDQSPVELETGDVMVGGVVDPPRALHLSDVVKACKT